MSPWFSVKWRRCRLRLQTAISAIAGSWRLAVVIRNPEGQPPFGRAGKQDARPLFLSSYAGTAIELYSLFTSLEVS